MERILIVGLGNHGNTYSNTKHNIGFRVLDFFAKQHGLTFDENKFKGIYLKTNLFDKEIFLLKPQTYMNLSGQCVQPFISFFRIKLENVYIVYDDLDIMLGKIRYRESGSSGGQNGIKNIMEKLGTDKIKRFKMGINTLNRKSDAASYVLSNFSIEENEIINTSMIEMIEKINNVIK